VPAVRRVSLLTQLAGTVLSGAAGRASLVARRAGRASLCAVPRRHGALPVAARLRAVRLSCLDCAPVQPHVAVSWLRLRLCDNHCTCDCTLELRGSACARGRALWLRVCRWLRP